jgi:hypothetical protein
MSSYAWRKACTVLNVKRQEIIDAGWPLTLSAMAISWLQFTERADRSDLERELLSECAERPISFIEVKMIHRTFQTQRRLIRMGEPAVGRVVKTAIDEEVMVRTIAPADFKRWLAAQGVAPSKLITAWFDAVGLAGAGETGAPVATAAQPPATDTATPAPVVEAVEPASNAPAPTNRRTWRDVSETYLERKYKELQCPKVKDFYRKLHDKAGVDADSPFDKGSLQNHGSLFAREVGIKVTIKMIESFVTDLRKKMQI